MEGGRTAAEALAVAGGRARARRSAITANRDSALASRRVDRDRTTKARPGFPPGGQRVPALTVQAQISVCAPIAA